MPNAAAVRVSPRRSLILAAFAIVYVVWGSTYLGIRYGVETIPPFLMAGARFVLAGALLSAWALSRGAARPTKAQWKGAAIVGLLLFPLGNGILVWTETRIDSGIAALIVATEPFWVVLILWVTQHVRPRALVVAGIVAGFLGMVVLLGPQATGGGRPIDVAAALVLVGAAGSWALGSVYARTATLPRAPLLAAGLQMLIGGGALFVMSLVSGELARFDVTAVSTRSLVSFAYLVLLGSIVAFSAYSWLTVVAAPARLATYAYVNPVIAVVLGWAVAGEALNARIGLAAVIIVGAVVLITVGQRDAERAEGERPGTPVASRGGRHGHHAGIAAARGSRERRRAVRG